MSSIFEISFESSRYDSLRTGSSPVNHLSSILFCLAVSIFHEIWAKHIRLVLPITVPIMALVLLTIWITHSEIGKITRLY